MAYENFMSKTEDVVWLAYKLKNELGDKVSINQIGLWKEVLEAKFCLKGYNRYDRGIDFTVLYSDKEFLRISVGEIGAYRSSYEDKLVVLNELKNAISAIVRNGVLLGEPSVFYNVREDEYMIPHLEYIYADKENYIKSFQDKTIFDDGGIPEDVIVFDSAKEKQEFGIVKDYCYVTPDAKNRYSINIYAMLKNKSDIEEKELKNVIIENLDDLFKDDFKNLFIDYSCYDNDISYVVACIKKALSLVEEQELYIVIKKDGKEIHNIRYVNEQLVKYESSRNLFEYNLDTYYDIENGIKFNTNCALGASDIIEKGVSEELKNINILNDINNQYNVKSNNNLLKLARRMGNR